MKIIILLFSILFLLSGTVIARNSFHSLNKLNIFDSNGKNVGTVISIFNISAHVAFNINGISYVVLVRNDRFQGIIQTSFYTSSNCTGQTYIDKGDADMIMANPSVIAPIDVLSDSDNETLFEADTANQQNITYNSFWSSSSKSCTTDSANIDAFPANPIFNLSDKFQPPYSLE